MEFNEWRPIAAELLAAYPQLQIPPETLVKYASSLRELPTFAVTIAARAAVKRCTFFPTIAEISELAEAEVSKSTAQAEVRRLPGEPKVSLEERQKLVEKWGPVWRKALADRTGPLASDLTPEAVGVDLA